MRMPALARSLVIGALAVTSLWTVGCSADYWREIASVSVPHADVASPGKVEWTQTKDDVTGEVTKAEPKVSEPTVALTLDANSSPVTYTTAQADYYYTEAALNDANKPVLNQIQDVPTQYFPFMAVLKPGERTSAPVAQSIVMNGVVPINLVDITNPTQSGFQRLTTVVAKVTLKGTNGFGGAITTTVNVPIVIDYK